MAERASPRDRLDPETLAYSVVHREDVRLSADGTRLTYTRHPTRPDGRSRPEIVVVEGLDSRPRPRVIARRSSLARWSPDDRCLAMAGSDDRGVRLGIRGAVADGASLYIGDPLHAIDDIAWSPDGRRLAILATIRGVEAATDSSEAGRLGIVDAERATTDWLAVTGEAAGIAWSPDGRQVAARVRDRNGYTAWLEVIDVESGAVVATIGDATSRILGMAWSPDGASLVVLGAITFSFHPGLHRYDLSTGQLAEIIDPPAPYVADLGGWLDGGRMLVHGRERARSGLYELDIARGRLELGIDLAGRAWGLTTDATGRRFATVRETATEPPAVIAGDVASGTWSRVKDVGRSLDDVGPKGRAVSVTIPAGDVTLDAWILGAGDAGGVEPQVTRPAVLMVHGGPHHDLGDEWDVGVAQVLADHGIVVAWTNPRGSTSYGRAFTDAVRGDVGGAELDDLLAVADVLAARPDVDPDRIGICGYSHGGFLAASAITRTRRFAAAVCWAPFTDLLSEWGMSDEGRGWGRWVVGADPMRDPDHYHDRSPSWHVTGPTAPTLLIHGERDDRCPIGQSELFHQLLAMSGTTTRLVRVPDADHALFETPAHTAEVARETLAWFTAHLRPDTATA